jgi:xylulokinase
VKIYVGVDIGSTRTKVGAYDPETKSMVAVRVAKTAVMDDELGGHRDARLLVDSVERLIDELLTDPAVMRSEVCGVSVGSVGEEVVMLTPDGQPTGHVLCWYASHGALAKSAIIQEDVESRICALDSSFSVFKLAWLARHRPDEIASAETWTDLADYVAWSLAGSSGRVFMNCSHASRTGVLDLARRQLDLTNLRYAGVPDIRLPELVPSGRVVARTPATGPLPADVPIVTGGHDHFCGAFGAGVRTRGMAYLSAGTSEAQLVLTATPPVSQMPGVDVGLYVADDLYYVHRATPSGRYFRTWRELLFPDTSDDAVWSEVEEAQASAQPVTFTDDLSGCTFSELGFQVSRGELMASLMKGLAVEADRTTDLLERQAETPINGVVVAGLAASSQVWREIRSAATKRRLTFVEEPEATLLGIAMLAQYGVAAER